jgi:hypothetical protein
MDYLKYLDLNIQTLSSGDMVMTCSVTEKMLTEYVFFNNGPTNENLKNLIDRINKAFEYDIAGTVRIEHNNYIYNFETFDLYLLKREKRYLFTKVFFVETADCLLAFRDEAYRLIFINGFKISNEHVFEDLYINHLNNSYLIALMGDSYLK